ncbi:MAG: chromosome partitioning protein ParB [Serratia inhibens]|uniref:chromosome partitioning protein ParB n=1 Tax=Serratia inhibens TaxID=2338073 RepID=UPI003C79727F
MANSFKQMIKSGMIKRRDDGMYIQLKNIFIQDGFNSREDDEYTRAGNEDTYQYMKNGGQVPAIEVVPRDEGGIWVREGHRRTLANRRLQSEGEPVDWIHITPCKGNDVDQQARVMSSDRGLKLRFFEEANNVKKMLAFNLTPLEISVKTSRSISHINKLLRFIDASHEVQTLAKTEQISLDVIIDRLDSHGSKAADALKGDVEKAKLIGKTRVTRSVANTVFSASKSRNFVKILAQAEVREIDGQTAYILPAGTQLDVLAILDDYRSTSTKENSDDQAL